MTAITSSGNRPICGVHTIHMQLQTVNWQIALDKLVCAAVLCMPCCLSAHACSQVRLKEGCYSPMSRYCHGVSACAVDDPYITLFSTSASVPPSMYSSTTAICMTQRRDFICTGGRKVTATAQSYTSSMLCQDVLHCKCVQSRTLQQCAAHSSNTWLHTKFKSYGRLRSPALCPGSGMHP